MIHRSIAVAVAALAAAACLAGAPASAAYPEKPITLIVPTTPGSNPDQVARLIGPQLGAALGQPVVVENRPGAGGTIGLHAVASARPDGYTLGVQTLPFVVTPSLLPKVPYDTERDLAPVTLVNWNYSVLVVPDASPARTVADLVALSRSTPGGLTYSSPGNGTPPHLVLTLLARETGAHLVHVPYKGGPASVGAILGGQVDLTVGGAHNLAPHIQAGKLRALATTAPRRLAAFPDLPTLVELGYADVELVDWQGIVAPHGTPADVIERLNEAIARILDQPEVRHRLDALGMAPAALGPRAFATYLHGDLEKWSTLVRRTGMKAD